MVSIQAGAPLARYTTLGVGGPAWGLAEAETVDELVEAAAIAEREGRRLLVMGGGSNMLVSDQGFDGLVVRHRDRHLEIFEDGRLIAGAGATWDDVVGASVAAGLVGIECLSGIPGWAGAAPIQNIGAYGQEVSETLIAVRALDRTSGRIDRLVNSACNFGYRTSRFKEDWRERYVVVGIELQLRRGAPSLRYGELSQRLGDPPHSPEQVRAAVIAIRRTKSMVIDDRDPNRMSAGSFFMNPIVETALADEVERLANARPPRFPQAEGKEKLSAAWLIERAGFSKGWGEGAAGLSTNHCLALVNRGGASAIDLVKLAAEIRRKVRGTFGVELVPEPVFVGFDAPADVILDRY